LTAPNALCYRLADLGHALSRAKEPALHIFSVLPVEPDTPVRARAWPRTLLLAVLLASPHSAHAGSAGTPTVTPTPAATYTPVPPCGNGIVDPGETCDPPDLTIDPQNRQLRCRLDCTRCGDGQAQSYETCDDGNTVSGCDPKHLQRPLDGCQNNCTEPICADPARIKLGGVLGVFDLHGGITTMRPGPTIDPTLGPFTVRLTSPEVAGGVVYEATLPAGLEGSAGRYRYKNRDARTSGGLARVMLVKRKDAYGLTLRTYGNLDLANAHMTTHIVIGDQEWTVSGLWESTRKGWRLRASGTVGASPP
jgi:cysteine-rich repeat protein